MPLTRLPSTSITGTLAKARLPSGSVIQIVSSTITYNLQTTSTNYITIPSASGTDWETAITPTFSSSKIFIMPSLMVQNSKNGIGDSRYGLYTEGKIGSGSYSRIGTSTATAPRFGAYDHAQISGSGALDGGFHNEQFLWSPSTTDECKIQFKVKGNGGTIDINSSDWQSTLTLMEIAG